MSSNTSGVDDVHSTHSDEDSEMYDFVSSCSSDEEEGINDDESMSQGKPPIDHTEDVDPDESSPLESQNIRSGSSQFSDLLMVSSNPTSLESEMSASQVLVSRMESKSCPSSPTLASKAALIETSSAVARDGSDDADAPEATASETDVALTFIDTPECEEKKSQLKPSKVEQSKLDQSTLERSQLADGMSLSQFNADTAR